MVRQSGRAQSGSDTRLVRNNGGTVREHHRKLSEAGLYTY